MRVVSVLALILFVSPLHAQDREAPQYPCFGYEVARTHEIKAHRRTIPKQKRPEAISLPGVRCGELKN